MGRVLTGAYRIVQRLTGLDPRLLDGVLAVVLSVGAAVQLLTEEPGNFTRMVWVMGTCLPLVIRRRLPIVCHALQVGFQIMAQRTPVSISLLAVFIGLYSVAVYSRWRVPFLAWLALGAVLIGVAFPESRTNVPSWASELVGGLAVWLAGSAMHQRHLQADAVELKRARRGMRERDLPCFECGASDPGAMSERSEQRSAQQRHRGARIEWREEPRDAESVKDRVGPTQRFRDP